MLLGSYLNAWASRPNRQPQVYRILLKYTACVQPLSCDEAYLDVTGLGDPEQIAAAIRAEIVQETECTASAGEARSASALVPAYGFMPVCGPMSCHASTGHPGNSC